MKKGPLTVAEVRHVEHRFAVLTSFLDVFSDPTFSRASDLTKEDGIFRGCMDGAMATCRAVCERFDLTMNSSSWTAALQPCPATFKSKTRVLFPRALDSECEALWEVLIAANRCVCHLEDKLIDHNVRPEILRDAVGLVRNITRFKLSEANLPSRVI